MTELKCIESDGGPFVLISKSKLSRWKGTSQDSLDYERASQVNEYLEQIENLRLSGIGLGYESATTTFFISKDNTPVIARWIHGPSLEKVNSKLLLLNMKDIEQWQGPTSITLTDDTQYIFDSAIAANDIIGLETSYLELAVPKGLYTISFFHFGPKETNILLQRLVFI